jgi:hypothetical protein
LVVLPKHAGKAFENAGLMRSGACQLLRTTRLGGDVAEASQQRWSR